MKPVGSKEKIRQFLIANVGKIVTSREIQEAAGGVVQYDRRLRELREEEGWHILSHNDSKDLKPDEYLLESLPPPKKDVTFKRAISARLRAQVLDRNGLTCQMCGIAAGEFDPTTGRKARLHVGHIKDKSLGGKDELSNLRSLCSECNQGAKNVTSEKPTAMWLLMQIRRAGHDEKRAVYDWLRQLFEKPPIDD